ncbi:hypothetical protein A9Q84_13840 [Halobacteriovorax marinus]|uniref:Lipoprotein n=1 Tax=Halobacteriovorax marinus TaxID=97084 RepID=A0A1Y5FFL1_9BACT|nr:hypothetical protein A9Q84_13840 [Halobacteriovorax marinus]
MKKSLFCLLLIILVGCSAFIPKPTPEFQAVKSNDRASISKWIDKPGIDVNKKVVLYKGTEHVSGSALGTAGCVHKKPEELDKTFLLIKWLIEEKGAAINSTGWLTDPSEILPGHTVLYNVGTYCPYRYDIVKYIIDKGGDPKVFLKKQISKAYIDKQKVKFGTSWKIMEKTFVIQSDPIGSVIHFLTLDVKESDFKTMNIKKKDWFNSLFKTAQLLKKHGSRIITVKNPYYLGSLAKILASTHRKKGEMSKILERTVEIALSVGADPNQKYPPLFFLNGKLDIETLKAQAGMSMNLFSIVSGIKPKKKAPVVKKKIGKTIYQIAKEKNYKKLYKLLIKGRKEFLARAIPQMRKENSIAGYLAMLQSVSEPKYRSEMFRKIIKLLRAKENGQNLVYKLYLYHEDDHQYFPPSTYLVTKGPKSLTIGKIVDLVRDKTPESIVIDLIGNSKGLYPTLTKREIKWLKKVKITSAMILTMDQVTENTKRNEVLAIQQEERRKQQLQQQRAQQQKSSGGGGAGFASFLSFVPVVGGLISQVQSKIPGGALMGKASSLTSGKFTTNTSASGLLQNSLSAKSMYDSRNPAASAPSAPTLEGKWVSTDGRSTFIFNNTGTGKLIKKKKQSSAETDFNWDAAKEKIIFTYKHTITTHSNGKKSFVDKSKDIISKYILTAKRLSIDGVLYLRK